MKRNFVQKFLHNPNLPFPLISDDFWDITFYGVEIFPFEGKTPPEENQGRFHRQGLTVCHVARGGGGHHWDKSLI